MTIDARTWFALACCAASGCALPPPPAPRDIDCEQIDRAEERFPEECGDTDADATADAGVDAESSGE
ncbi:MAG TPA: hypothetical protein VFZ61_31935 [Polyangiales bacterium]